MKTLGVQQELVGAAKTSSGIFRPLLVHRQDGFRSLTKRAKTTRKNGPDCGQRCHG